MFEPYQFEVVWQKWDEPLIEELVQYWSIENLIDSEEAAKRAKQGVVIVRNAEHAIVGLTSVEASLYEPFKNWFYFLRSSVSRRAGGNQLTIPLFNHTFAVLNDCFQQSSDTVIGIMAIIQSQHLDKRLSEAVRPETGLIFAGYTAKGQQIRVRYFDDAVININL